MIEDSLKKIEAVLHAVDAYQLKSLEGDFEKRGLETPWPDVKSAFNAVNEIRKELKLTRI